MKVTSSILGGGGGGNHFFSWKRKGNENVLLNGLIVPVFLDKRNILFRRGKESQIHHFSPECIAFSQSALCHEQHKDVILSIHHACLGGF